MASRKSLKAHVALAITITALVSLTNAAPRGKAPAVPDFTKGDPIGEKHDWNLGPTGARGWMWGWKDQTTKARQISITKVDQGSPADGILTVGDVILGINNQPFSRDARYAFSDAITAAEASDGKLPLLRWRGGKTESVTLQLAPLGSYTDTAPFNCPKSQSILHSGSQSIAAQMQRSYPNIKTASWQNTNTRTSYGEGVITDMANSLALLASGKPEYSELVQKFAHAYAPADLEIDMSPNTNMASWGWGYINLFLCEYYLATGDKAVLPAIKKYSIAIAKGQSFIGSWGHTMAWPQVNGGKLHGSLMGYGALNSAGLICHLSLVLAEKCNVKHEEITQAISKANKFIGFYAGKGAIPYGDHMPNSQWHDDNGKNSMAAIIFDLQGLTEQAHFFSAMTVASYGEREKGHTGNYFSLMWGGIGAQRAGDAASAAFLAKQRGFFDFNRSWKGSFPYQGKADAGKGENSYSGWDCTGAFILNYTLPMKRLYITGKGTSEKNAIKGDQLTAVIASGEGYTAWDKGMTLYHQKSTTDLLSDLSSWSPAVRFRAAEALGKKADKDSLLTSLLKMLKSDSLTARYGACQAIGALGKHAKPAVPALQELLFEDDTWLRIQAVSALTNIGETSRSAIPKLLQLVLHEDEADPLQMTQRFLAFGLFDSKGVYGNKGLLSKSIEGVDKKILYQAVEKILTNPDGRSRGTVSSIYKQLSYDEIKPILPAILLAVKEPSPSGVMFSSEIRIRGVELLAKHRIREGLELCVDTLEINKWGKNRRLQSIIPIIGSYGGSAKIILPRLRQLEKDLINHREARMLRPRLQQLQTLIKEIETAKEAKPLRTLNK